MVEEFAVGVDGNGATDEVLAVAGDDAVEVLSDRAVDLHGVFKVIEFGVEGIFEDSAIDGADRQGDEDRGDGLSCCGEAFGLSSGDVEDVGQGCGGDVAVDRAFGDSAEELVGVFAEWVALQEVVEDDVGIEQDLHELYF